MLARLAVTSQGRIYVFLFSLNTNKFTYKNIFNLRIAKLLVNLSNKFNTLIFDAHLLKYINVRFVCYSRWSVRKRFKARILL